MGKKIPWIFLKYQLDKSIFFNSDSSKCLLILSCLYSEKSGHASLLVGTRRDTSWVITTGKPYYNVSFTDDLLFFRNPTSETVARLMKFKVLKAGDIRSKGCEFDARYWLDYFYSDEYQKRYKQRMRIRL